MEKTPKRGPQHSKGGGSIGSKKEPLPDAPPTLKELGIDAEDKFGEVVEKMAKNKGAKGSVVTGKNKLPVMDPTPTYAEQGIDKTTASRAERRLGEILKETPKSEGGRPIKTGSKKVPVISTPTLKDLGIDKKLSSRAQRFADLSAAAFNWSVNWSVNWHRPITRPSSRRRQITSVVFVDLP